MSTFFRRPGASSLAGIAGGRVKGLSPALAYGAKLKGGSVTSLNARVAPHSDVTQGSGVHLHL